MKVVGLAAPCRVEIEAMDLPKSGPHEVLIRVESAVICGSDLGGFKGCHTRCRPPLVPGYEMVSVFEECPGDRSATRSKTGAGRGPGFAP